MQDEVKLRRAGRRGYATSVGLATMAMLCMCCCTKAPLRIAVIPRTTAMGLWEPEHRGADAAADKIGAHIYWNAPTREDDVEGQIALVDQVRGKGYEGLVLAPDQVLALITPVRRTLARGIPVVIVSSQLPIPGGGKLSYILNDDETGGRLAGQRVAELVHGRGSVAVLGVNPDITGIMIRARSFELFLRQKYPDIHILKRRGSFNFLHEQQVAEEVLKTNPKIDVMVGLMWASARGAMSAIRMIPRSRNVRILGFDPDGAIPFDIESFDSVIMQDTRLMGERAVDLIAAERRGSPMPESIKLQPTLITRKNVASPEIRQLTSMDWRPGGWAATLKSQ